MLDYSKLAYPKPISVKKTPNPIAKKSKTSKNIARSLNSDIISQVYTRDWFKCILCWSKTLDLPHHVLYWIESEYWEDRNNINKLVTLCKADHFKIHHQSWWKELNNKCKEYLWMKNQ